VRGSTSALQGRVGPIAKGHGLGVFARAPCDRRRFGDLNFLGFEPSAFVGTIAKGLALGAPASTPPISAGLDFLNDGPFLKNERLSHLAG